MNRPSADCTRWRGPVPWPSSSAGRAFAQRRPVFSSKRNWNTWSARLFRVGGAARLERTVAAQRERAHLAVFGAGDVDGVRHEIDSSDVRAFVIGGSGGGLLAGCLFRKAGWDVTVYERAIGDLA